MKKKLFILAALTIMCTLTTTTVLTSCGDDENVNPSDGYTYSITYNLAETINGVSSERTEIENALKKAVGFEGDMYKDYSTCQDEQMKAACDAIWQSYKDKKPGLQSFYLSFSLYGKKTLSTDKTELKKYIFGQCTTKACAAVEYEENYSNAPIVAFGDSLYALKTPADSAKYKTMLHISHNSLNSIRDDFKKNLRDKDYLDKENQYVIHLEEDIPYVKTLCDSIAKVHENDSLLTDFTVNITKRSFYPERKKELYWTKTFKANMQGK